MILQNSCHKKHSKSHIISALQTITLQNNGPNICDTLAFHFLTSKQLCMSPQQYIIYYVTENQGLFLKQSRNNMKTYPHMFTQFD